MLISTQYDSLERFLLSSTLVELESQVDIGPHHRLPFTQRRGLLVLQRLYMQLHVFAHHSEPICRQTSSVSRAYGPVQRRCFWCSRRGLGSIDLLAILPMAMGLSGLSASESQQARVRHCLG